MRSDLIPLIGDNPDESAPAPPDVVRLDLELPRIEGLEVFVETAKTLGTYWLTINERVPRC